MRLQDGLALLTYRAEVFPPKKGERCFVVSKAAEGGHKFYHRSPWPGDGRSMMRLLIAGGLLKSWLLFFFLLFL